MADNFSFRLACGHPRTEFSFPLASSSIFDDDCAEGAFCSSAVLHNCSFLQSHLIILFPNVPTDRLLLVQTSFVGIIYICKTKPDFFAVVANCLLYELAYASHKLQQVLQEANQYHKILVANQIALIVASQVSKGNILQITRNAGFFFFYFQPVIQFLQTTNT